MNLPIGVKGYIRNEGVLYPYIIIEAALGGYLILQSNSPKFDGSIVPDSNGIVVYDDWVLEEDLERFYEGWQVEWMEETAPVAHPQLL